MENGHRTDKQGNVRAEEDYAAHQHDPAPSPEAIKEKDDRPASYLLRWAIVIAIALLAIIYLVFIL